MKSVYFIVGIVTAVISFGAFADDAPTVSDTQRATSKTYVDNQVGAKQQKLSGTPGTVVTYGNTAGAVGSRAIYTTGGTYSNQTTALVEANQVNTAIQNGLNSHVTCSQTATDGTGRCLLWSINSANGTYLP